MVQHQKITPDAVEPFDPKDAIIDKANRKIKALQATVENLEAKEGRRMSSQASRCRLKPIRRLAQPDGDENTQLMPKRQRAVQEASAQ